MRTSRSLVFYTVFLLFSTFSAAWPWPRWLPELDAIVVRQNNNKDTSSSDAPTATQTNAPKSTGSSKSGDSTITPAPSSDSASATNSGSTKQSSNGSNKVSSKTSATKTHSTSFDARLPAGGISMVTPNIMSGAQYYKIGDFVTFAWNYTSLLATPTAINIMATCTENNQLYTLALNQTIGNSTGAVTWDTGSYQATAASAPLLTETYTLIIYDAASSISATAQAGYLAVYDQYTFGMYSPQAYTPLADYTCATCSAAFSDMERRAIGMVVGMSVLTVLSFTWFVGGTGVIW